MIRSADSSKFSQPGPDLRAFSAAKIAFTNVSFVRNTALTGGAMLQVDLEPLVTRHVYCDS